MGMDEDMDELLNGMSEEMRELAMENRFPYLFAKSYLYLQMGPDAYRTLDAFDEPSDDLDAEDLTIIESGCRQVMEGKGLTPEDPFRGLGISGFYALFRLFHFTRIRQSVTPNTQGMLDRMEMQHVVDGSEVIYYNLVQYDLGGFDFPEDGD